VGPTTLVAEPKGAGMETVPRYSMLINGDWVAADERFEIRSPATEDVVASVAKGGQEHADRAVAAAKAAHEGGEWRRTPPGERAAVLDAIAGRLGEAVNELAVLEAQELGPHSLDEYTEEKFIHLDLSGRLDRRAYALLLSTPPA
jgi:acyl-CoA reductase-like NAD-dependent aldehyde dehydrogenase